MNKIIKTYLLAAFMMCAFHYGIAGNYYFYGGARSAAMSNSVIMSPRLSYMQNQAALGWLDSTAVAIYSLYQPQLPQLSVVAAQGRLPLLGGGMGLQVQRFGYDVYNENKVGLGYGKTLGEHFSAGVQFSYLYTHLDGPYKSYHSLVAEAGVQARFSDRWLFGVHLYNPTLSKTGEHEDETPETILRAGAGVIVTDELIITSEIEKHIDQDINFRMGIDYQFDMGLNFQAGFQTHPRQFSAGAGYRFRNFEVQLAVTSNTYLEPATHFSLQYYF